MDGGGAFLGVHRKRNPIADPRKARLLGFVKQAARHLGPQLSLVGGRQIAVALLDDDAPGAVTRARMLREGLLQQIGPSV